MGQSFRVALSVVVGMVAFAGAAYALNEPPSQVGRLAYTEGSVSFHDDEQAGWSPAVINTPLTSGDSIWTEPNARSEISVAGTRVRMDGSTQLNMLAIEDNQTQLQVGQGRVDIKTYSLNPNIPYSVVTPRGTINLRQQGDYYVEAGSTQDATRLGVRSGAAQIQGLNGQMLTVNAGQVGEVFGDSGALQMRTVNSASPALPASWAARDRQVNYDLPTQYLSAGITGYEDLNANGTWSNDSQYGNVWTPRSVPSGWQPYKEGHWTYVKPYGWTWVDDQPWGYAPSHYGRWANRNNQWVWVPPQRETQPVYAPALVDFIGGVQLIQALLGGGTSLGAQNSAPVGWFPLGPREAYVPSYSTDRAYYTRLNSSNQVQQQALDERWLRAQRREAYIAGQNNTALANQRFTTVIPSTVFVNSQPVARAALQVSPAQIAAAPVAPVAAPPAPTASLAVAAPATAAPAAAPKAADSKAATPAPAANPKAEADAKARAEAQAKVGANANLPVAKTAIADMPTLAKPTTQKPAAPGPKLATAPNTPAATTNATGSTPVKKTAPPLVPRTGAAPPALKDDKAPAAPAPGTPQAKAPTATDTKAPSLPNAVTPAPAAPAPATQAPAVPAPTKPATAEPPKAAPVTPQAAKPVEPIKPATPPTPAPAPQQQAKPDPAKPVEAPKPAAPKAAEPAQPAPPAPHPAETRTPPPADNKAPDKGAAVTPQIPAPAATPNVQPPKPVTVEPKVAIPQPPVPAATPPTAPVAIDTKGEVKIGEKPEPAKEEKK
ncbi:MAG: hypothetical protein PSV46_21080 [Reyranella sp.]|nr:hypothetical protein [Reyranella sp.]